MLNEFSHMEALLGEKGTRKLGSAKIAVFGLGGAGSYAAEALARCGVGSLTLVDYAPVTLTNINRQLYALHSTIGMPKAQVAKKRIHDINEDILVHTYETFFGQDTESIFDFSAFDYIIDTIDTVPSKLLLLEKASKSKTPVISSMGTRGKLDPSLLRIADLSKVRDNENARYLSVELKKRGIRKVKVLFVNERNWKKKDTKNSQLKKPGAGSISFMPGIAGLMIAGEVIKDLLEEKKALIK